MNSNAIQSYAFKLCMIYTTRTHLGLTANDGKESYGYL